MDRRTQVKPIVVGTGWGVITQEKSIFYLLNPEYHKTFIKSCVGCKNNLVCLKRNLVFFWAFFIHDYMLGPWTIMRYNTVLYSLTFNTHFITLNVTCICFILTSHLIPKTSLPLLFEAVHLMYKL